MEVFVIKRNEITAWFIQDYLIEKVILFSINLLALQILTTRQKMRYMGWRSRQPEILFNLSGASKTPSPTKNKEIIYI